MINKDIIIAIIVHKNKQCNYYVLDGLPINVCYITGSGLNQSNIRLKLLSPTNAPLYYTYKMLKYTVKISHECSYMFRSIWTIIREPMPNLAKVTILCRYSVKIRR
jgi:hypothetical protein